jgi:hypothetical protein
VIDTADQNLVSARGDGDDDDDVDLADFAMLQRCVGGSNPGDGCFRFDLNTNQGLDEQDFAWFIDLLSGPLAR